MKTRVLFLCTGNSARSQMAEALLQLMAGDRCEAASAGTHPVGVNPVTVEVMKELGCDMTQRRSKSVQEFVGQRFDYVITVCDRAKDTCPVFPAAVQLLHWSFEDPAMAPADQRREVFRRIRDEIADRLCQFLVQECIVAPGMVKWPRDPLAGR